MGKLLVEVNNLIDVFKKSTAYRNIAPTIKDFYFYDAIIIIIEGIENLLYTMQVNRTHFSFIITIQKDSFPRSFRTWSIVFG